MADIVILTERELRAAVALDLDSVAVVDRAFRRLATGDVVMPPILSMEIAASHGEVDVKTAYIPGFDSFAIKVSSGFFDNPKLGLGSLGGLMILFSATTGLVQAVLLDNGYLTDIRTAAAGAVAARALAPKDARVAGVMGTGLQARLQMQAAALVRPIERILVWGRDLGRAEVCAADIAAVTGIETSVEPDPAKLVRSCALVVTTTPARLPILQADWLHPGLHVTAMGSDQPGKNELHADVLKACDLYVGDRLDQTARLGELRAARQDGVEPRRVAELGDVLNAVSPGRRDEDAVTVCDLTGTGAQDTAIATHAFALARRAGKGRLFSS